MVAVTYDVARVPAGEAAPKAARVAAFFSSGEEMSIKCMYPHSRIRLCC